MEKEIAEKVNLLIASGRTVSTMESCTGGLLASTITDQSSASDIFLGGLVTYSNKTKEISGVPEKTIIKYGVYSKETAEAMAKACASVFGSDIGVGITGSLGRKDPNNADSIVGKVWYSIFTKASTAAFEITIPETITDRHEMKMHVIKDVLIRLVAYI